MKDDNCSQSEKAVDEFFEILVGDDERLLNTIELSSYDLMLSKLYENLNVSSEAKEWIKEIIEFDYVHMPNVKHMEYIYDFLSAHREAACNFVYYINCIINNNKSIRESSEKSIQKSHSDEQKKSNKHQLMLKLEPFFIIADKKLAEAHNIGRDNIAADVFDDHREDIEKIFAEHGTKSLTKAYIDNKLDFLCNKFLMLFKYYISLYSNSKFKHTPYGNVIEIRKPHSQATKEKISISYKNKHRGQ